MNIYVLNYIMKTIYYKRYILLYTMVTKEELLTSEKVLFKYTRELKDLRGRFDDINGRYLNAKMDVDHKIERARPIVDKLEPEVIKLREQIQMAKADMIEADRLLSISKKSYKHIDERTIHNQMTKKEADNHNEPYTDDELEVIFINCNDPWNEFMNEGVEEYRIKFKRTYCAIEAFVRAKQEYDGEVRDFYWENGVLTKTGEQIQKVLNKLIKEKKITL